jgi:AraC family transcriptional regulator
VTTPVGIGQFVGAPVHAHRFDGVSLAENTYAPGLLVGAHVHDAPLVSLVLQGTATEEAGGSSRELTAQTLLYTPAFATHGHRFVTAGRWLNIQFTAAWFERVGAAQNLLRDSSQLVHGGAAVNWASRLGIELRQPDTVSRLAIEGALLLLVSELARLPDNGERRRPRWLHAVEEAIDVAGPAAPALADLAALAGVHASHLLRTFRRYHGTTIANYARQRRIERARAALATSTQPLSMIALDAGFADQSHFTKVFKQAFGETPGQYVRSLRRK